MVDLKKQKYDLKPSSLKVANLLSKKGYDVVLEKQSVNADFFVLSKDKISLLFEITASMQTSTANITVENIVIRFNDYVEINNLKTLARKQGILVE